DTDAAVGRAAREVLAATGEVAWWRGIYARDPAERLPPAKLTELRPLLDDLAAYLNADAYARCQQPPEKLAGLLARLPAVLGVEVAERLLVAPDISREDLPGVVAYLLGQPEAPEMLLRLLPGWVGTVRTHDVSTLLGD